MSTSSSPSPPLPPPSNNPSNKTQASSSTSSSSSSYVRSTNSLPVIFSLSSLRPDGRLSLEYRPLVVSPFSSSFSSLISSTPSLTHDGQCRLTMGGTTILSTIFGLRDSHLKSSLPLSSPSTLSFTQQGSPLVITLSTKGTGENSMGAESTYMEICEYLFSSLSSVILLPKGKYSLLIDITVESDDGAIMSAATNCTIMALCRSGIPMVGMLSCCQLGIVENKYLIVDSTRQERRDITSDITVAFIHYKTEKRDNYQSQLAQAEQNDNESDEDNDDDDEYADDENDNSVSTSSSLIGISHFSLKGRCSPSHLKKVFKVAKKISIQIQKELEQNIFS